MQNFERTPSQQLSSNRRYANVVGDKDKPCLDSVFSERKNKKIKKKKVSVKAKKLTRHFLWTESEMKQQSSLKLDNAPCARVTRAACTRKESIINPIVISEVQFICTFIVTSISALHLLMYVFSGCFWKPNKTVT